MGISYQLASPVSEDALDALFAAAWVDHHPHPCGSVLSHSLTYICAYRGDKLVGFVNLAWDGGVHAFLLDTTVRPDMQRQGIGTELVRRAAAFARERGIEWLHVDFDPHLAGFYRGCGFRPTAAGLMPLRHVDAPANPAETCLKPARGSRPGGAQGAHDT